MARHQPEYDALTPKLDGKYDVLRPKAWGLWHHIASVLILASMAHASPHGQQTKESRSDVP
ncbi:MAG: hypothetical protein KKD01_19780 [Proteobacteria bacterium]|nr:hypothetical protein [Pseudomonadota bacterium]